MKKLGTIEVFSTLVEIHALQYTNGRLAISLEEPDGSPFATFSVNIPEIPVGPGEFLAKTWNENEDLREPMLATGLFEDTGRRAVGDFVTAEVWRLKPSPEH